MNKKMRLALKKAVKTAVKKLEKKGLIALYYAGNEDITRYSDIDLFGIVSKKFDIDKEEKEINAHYEAERQKTYNGFEVRFRGIGTDELKGGKPRGVLNKHIGLNSIVRKFPFYRHVYGKSIDFSKFSIKPATPKEEAQKYISQIEEYLKKLKKGEEVFHIQNLPKKILYLAAVEAEKDYGFKYHTSYKRLAKHLRNQKSHIVHKIMKLRRKKVTRRDILALSNKILAYTKHMKQRVKEY